MSTYGNQGVYFSIALSLSNMVFFTKEKDRPKQVQSEATKGYSSVIKRKRIKRSQFSGWILISLSLFVRQMPNNLNHKALRYHHLYRHYDIIL